MIFFLFCHFAGSLFYDSDIFNNGGKKKDLHVSHLVVWELGIAALDDVLRDRNGLTITDVFSIAPTGGGPQSSGARRSAAVPSNYLCAGLRGGNL